MKDISDMNYSEFCVFVDGIENDYVESVICTDDYIIYHDTKDNRYYYLETAENDASEFYELDLVATLECHLRFDTNEIDYENLFESDCGGFIYVDNNHIRYCWFKKKIYFEWADIVMLPDGQVVAERHPISGIMDADAVYQIDDFYDAVAAKYNVNREEILTFMMDDVDFSFEGLPWGYAECGCYINGKLDESYEEWGYDGIGWTCSYCGEYAPGKNHTSKVNPNLPVCPHCKARMKYW